LKTLYLHIGRGKTGTTAQPAYLGRNRDALLAAGIDYLLAGDRGRGVGHQEFAKSFITDPPGTMIPARDPAGIRAETAAKMERFDVRPPDPNLPARNFSGGNQQKIVLAREIERNPDLLLIGQPTRGVDIGAIEFIHQRIIQLRDEGKAILLVSVELDEIMSLSDRIAVMFDGKIMGERLPTETNETELGLLMAGVDERAA